MRTLTLAGRAVRSAGFTLIEVMIAMLIGVIGIVVMMQTFSVSEGFKRTATSGTDAQINGAVALYMLEREIRLAGYGMNHMIPSGCSLVRVWNNTLGSGTTMRMVPFEINPPGVPAGDANTDVVLIAYGSSETAVTGVPADHANFRVSINRDGFRNGDLVVGLQPGAGPGGANSCALHELTKVPGGSGNCNDPPPSSDALEHTATNYKNPLAGCQPVPASRNSAGGITEADGTPVPALNRANGGLLFNLGAQPQVKVYAVRGGNLTECNWMTADCTAAANFNVIVNDIVSLRAVYAMDLDGNPNPGTPSGDGIVDRYTRVPLATSNQISRVLGGSVALAARSGLREKPAGGGGCDATVDPARPDRAQEWFGPALSPGDGTLVNARMDLSGVPDWQCYRYKLFQTSVPLRNMIWKP
jgi:type IV pilus assembly protein PilW